VVAYSSDRRFRVASCRRMPTRANLISPYYYASKLGLDVIIKSRVSRKQQSDEAVDDACDWCAIRPPLS